MENLEVFSEKEYNRRKKLKEAELDKEIENICLRVFQRFGNNLNIIFTNRQLRKYNRALIHKTKPEKVKITYEKEGIPVEQEEKEETSDTIIPIDRTESKLIQEIKSDRKLFESEVIYNKNKRYDNFNQAELINSFEFVQNSGKIGSYQMGNTFTGKSISRHQVRNFGCISEYNVDTMPITNMKCKGTEVFYVTNDFLKNKNRDLISRRFLSDILSTWSYIIGIPYTNRKDMKFSGLEIWTIPMELRNKEDSIYGFTQHFLTGDKAIHMIRDLIFLTRNKDWNKVSGYMEKGIVSTELYNTIDTIRRKRKCDVDTILQEIKKRLYYDIQSRDGNHIWTYPKYRIEYLLKVLEELQSGNYYTDILIPIIYDLWKYPLECKDTHMKVMTDRKHEKNRDDYNITQYIWERN